MQFIEKNLLKVSLENRVKADIADNRLLGAAIHVCQNGVTLYHDSIGMADPEESLPVTEQTVFRLASMTKPITAAAVMILVERGLLTLDDPVDKFLPAYSSMRISGISEAGECMDLGPACEKPTVRRILSHTSGIGCGKLGAFQIRNMTASDKETLENTVSYFSRQGLSFEPGSKQEYSGFPAYDVLAAIIEIAADEPYECFLKRELLDPCDMQDTTYSPDIAQWGRMAAMHNRVDGKSIVTPMPINTVFEGIPCEHPLAGAGLVSTLNDYSHFASMLLNEGQYCGRQILSADSVREIRSPQVSAAVQPGLQRWGLGVRVITDSLYPYLPVGSYGWSGAYGPHFWIDPTNRITAIYMRNSFFDPGAGSVAGYHFEQDVYSSMR